MAEDVFNFMIYRLNKVSDDTLWSIFKTREMVNDNDIREFLLLACQEKFDETNETEKNIYKWSIRKGATILDEIENPVIDAYVIGRSLMEKDALVVDESGFHEDRSISSPAPAETMILLIYWKRHIALVENRSQMTTGETWLKYYNKIVQKVYADNEWNKFPQLENIPPDNEILKEFNSMDIVHRVKVTIKLPNPDMSRMTRALMEKLKQDSIDEIKQDMFSSAGLSKAENGLPHASLALADHGYKNGPVLIEGVKNNEYKKVETGTDTSKGMVAGLKTYIRGLRVNIKTKEAQAVIKAVEDELNNLVPTDD